ncbi:hypothetical protein RclHR1_06860001 [Rhizophagus clarus]|uniref:Protein kinase domain-containing protein n=1 Tax=Rhizophagus clarus TaxID=94130 RepID=A0A2Z6RUR4_9GLOM|nr:hypothetical protein RclHR1_06860001 [Rhizophagus clarus]
MEKAFHWYQKVAKSGDAEAMNNLALCYENGEGTEVDLGKAFHWYQKAAESGHIIAIFNLALCYKNGKGTEVDLKKAFHWYQKAAESGHTKAMNNLALCYENGEGTEVDLGKAFHWYQIAAENGHTIAIFNLALCYENGKGIEVDLGKAFHWYQKVAEGGHTKAMNNLALCYENGKGTEVDLKQAFHWYQKAADSGHTNAIFNLALCYENGEGTEVNLKKAFHWYQKAAESRHTNAMFNLALCYENGEGAEMDLEKAFQWYQKAAESRHTKAMNNLALCYENGKGTGVNLKKAFYWYQKAAKSRHTKVMFNLALCYENGKGIKVNLEEAFYLYRQAAASNDADAMLNLAFYYENWETELDLIRAFRLYQKVAERNDAEAMNSLARCYENGRGIEMDLGKAFHWYQKAAESGHAKAIFNLALCYKNGKGTEVDLEKAFYWYQKAAENNNISFKNRFCNKCKQLYTNYKWCQQCNSKQFQQDFSKWTSKNKYIDEFIQEAQLNAKNNYEVLEWIPYNKLLNIKYYDKGGFSKIYKAIWLDGPIDSWNFNKQQWNRWNSQIGYDVILKILDSSSDIDDKFLDEWKHHYNCQKNSFSKFIQFFGITQDPYNLNYIIVMSYAKKGNLRKCLSDIIKLKWQDKLQLLKKIILGLKVIHESNLIHSDLHDGNILMSDNYNELFIIDLGLCKPINDLQPSDKENNEIYGVVPYMAPEVLRKKPYTPASDIYSLSIIMWEFTSGFPPFNNRAHDHQLIYNICKNERPEIIRNTPKCYVNLMKRCWDSNPSDRPTITELEYKISEWIRCISKFYEINRDGIHKYQVLDGNDKLYNDMLEFVKANNTLIQEQTNISTIIQPHSQAYYTSRNITKVLVKEDSECLECIIKV